MKDEEKLMIKSNIVNGYTPKTICTSDRYGGVDDEAMCVEVCNYCGGDCDYCCIQEVFNRLAEYEETGLSPEEINQLKLKMR